MSKILNNARSNSIEMTSDLVKNAQYYTKHQDVENIVKLFFILYYIMFFIITLEIFPKQNIFYQVILFLSKTINLYISLRLFFSFNPWVKKSYMKPFEKRLLLTTFILMLSFFTTTPPENKLLKIMSFMIVVILFFLSLQKKFTINLFEKNVIFLASFFIFRITYIQFNPK